MPLITLNTHLKQNSKKTIPATAAQGIKDIASDLTWVDMLKGIAIIGVFFDNWLGFFLHHDLVASTQSPIYLITTVIKTAVGPFVQVFFILSGFGLAYAYFEHSNTGWSWKHWAWRRITKIIFPYYIFVILSFVFGMIGSAIYKTVDVQFSWTSLITYLTFTRNQYPPSWVWNPPLWYMPVIIGLYLIFPALLLIFRKWGAVKLFVISLLITIISLIIAMLAGARGEHGSDLFLFWTVQFSMGIILAYLRVHQAEKLRLLIGLRAFAIGSVLILFSWALRTYIPYANIFNDAITSTGIFLFLLNLGWLLRNIFAVTHNFFLALSKQSFFMYLIHFPIMSFFIGPLFTTAVHPVIVIVLGGVYILAIYLLCSFISKPIINFTARLYSK